MYKPVLILAPGGPDVVLCELCSRSVIFHEDGCPNDINEELWMTRIRQVNPEWPLPQAIAQACYTRGVALDDDLLRADMKGVFSFAPIVAKPTHEEMTQFLIARGAGERVVEEYSQAELSEMYIKMHDGDGWGCENCDLYEVCSHRGWSNGCFTLA